LKSIKKKKKPKPKIPKKSLHSFSKRSLSGRRYLIKGKNKLPIMQCKCGIENVNLNGNNIEPSKLTTSTFFNIN
jgi:hypothetical protein